MLIVPVQLAVATAALANRGKIVRPHLFSQARDAISEEIIMEYPDYTAKQISNIKDENLDKIIEAMTDVVHGDRGTARRSGINADYRFAGKTGTAQLFKIAQDEEYDAEEIAEKLRDHALFVAFAPVESPQIAVAIIIENGGSGSSSAAPIARLLFDHYFKNHAQLKDKK